MTTIVLNKEEIGSDLQYTEDGGQKKWKGNPKVFYCPAHENTYPHSGFHIGLCGKASDIFRVADYFQDPRGKPPKISGVGGAVLTDKGDIFCFDEPGIWMPVKEPYYAIGSGGKVALGALHMGATVKEALQAAGKVDSFTGMGYKVFKRKVV